jgi:hypothetical protein
MTSVFSRTYGAGVVATAAVASVMWATAALRSLGREFKIKVVIDRGRVVG